MKNVYVVKANNDIVGVFDNFENAKKEAIKVLFKFDDLDDVSVSTVPLNKITI